MSDTKLNKMTEERDHWRKKASEYQEEIADLKRKLDRAGIWEDAFAGGVRTKIDKAIENLQIDRDSLHAKVVEMATSVQNMINSVKKQSQNIAQSIENVSSIKPSSERGVLERVIKPAFALTDKKQRDVISESRDVYLAEHNIEEFDPINNMDACLSEIASYCIGIGSRTIQEAVTRTILDIPNTPEIIAYVIIWECRETGEPSPDLVSQLDLSWVDENLPNPPKKHITLQEGLKIRQQEINSGLSRKQFTIETTRLERSLLDYEKWYTTLDKISRSYGIATILDQQSK